MKARTKSRIIRSNLFVVRLERQELFRASNCWRLSEARKTGNRSCRCSIATAGWLVGEGKGRVEVVALSMRSRPEMKGRGGGEGGETGMRNRPVKLNPKLTVLLYVLTRRGGLDRIARHRRSLCPLFPSPRYLAPSPPRPRRRSRYIEVEMKQPERFRQTRNLGLDIRGNYMRIATESCRVELFPTTGHDR